jgi:hypothetical protein
MMWSVKPLITSGFGVVVGGGVDNDRFSFRPETVKQTFERVYRTSMTSILELCE